MNKFYILITCFVIAIIFGILFVFPQYQAIEVYRVQIQEIQQRIIIAREDVKLFQGYRRKIEQEFREQFNKINISLPSDKDIPSLLNFFQVTAAHEGLRLKNIEPFDTIEIAERPGMKETSMTFSVSGSYFDFKEFLRHLGRSARLINVKDINFTHRPEPGFDFTLTIKVYSY